MPKLNDFLLELFFPSFCLGCQKEGTYLCQDCKSTLEISEYNYCLCNKNPIRLPGQGGKCPKCQDRKLSGLYFALPYKENPPAGGLTRKLIHQFKYPPHIKTLAKALSEVLIEHFVLAKNNTEKIWQNSLLIPVPLEKKKLKSRGYNQAEELAKELSSVTKVPIILNNLIKTRETLPQIKLSAEKRQKNLTDSFSIKNRQEIAGGKIFLVDDVYTTGATMEECAHVLREAKAKQVWGIAIARES